MSVGTYVYPSGSSTFVRDHAATNYLITQYARNPKDFCLPKYIQYMPVKKEAGYYLRLNAEQCARLVAGDRVETVWYDSADAPNRNDGTEKFAFADFRTSRHAFPFRLGYKAREQAGWNIQDAEMANAAQRAMTSRTRAVHELMEDDANWDSAHVKDVTTISGITGTWDVSTTSRMDIKRSINYAVNQIRQATVGKVRSKKDLQLVMSPTTAQRIGVSQEMINAFIQSMEARKHWEGKAPDYDDYGIPAYLYGVQVVIEDAVMVTSEQNATTVTRDDVCEDDVAYLLARPGKLMAPSGGPSYSSVMMFQYEDMSTELKDDPDNRVVKGRVVDDIGVEMIAPATCFKFKNVLA